MNGGTCTKCVQDVCKVCAEVLEGSVVRVQDHQTKECDAVGYVIDAVGYVIKGKGKGKGRWK